jgi:hypothetical protein
MPLLFGCLQVHCQPRFASALNTRRSPAERGCPSIRQLLSALDKKVSICLFMEVSKIADVRYFNAISHWHAACCESFVNKFFIV